jgi:hypothetical protein
VVTIATYCTLVEAQALCTRLWAAGCDARLPEQHAAGILGELVGVRVQVPRHQMELALAVMNEAASPDAPVAQSRATAGGDGGPALSRLVLDADRLHRGAERARASRPLDVVARDAGLHAVLPVRVPPAGCAAIRGEPTAPAHRAGRDLAGLRAVWTRLCARVRTRRPRGS